jgi:ribosomal-protein-alanine N-acetyltransferase
MLFETERLIVRSPVLQDAADIFRNYAQDPEVTKYLTWEAHSDIAQTEQWIQYCMQNAETSSGLICVIFHKIDRQAVGMFDFRFDGFKAEFGYVLAKKYWGKGLMTEAVKPALERVYRMPEIFRIWAVHDVDNPASGRVMEKLGLVYEGTLGRFSLHPNISKEPRDARLYALCK